jgi:hypothetical protein
VGAQILDERGASNWVGRPGVCGGATGGKCVRVSIYQALHHGGLRRPNSLTLLSKPADPRRPGGRCGWFGMGESTDCVHRCRMRGLAFLDDDTSLTRVSRSHDPNWPPRWMRDFRVQSLHVVELKLSLHTPSTSDA